MLSLQKPYIRVNTETGCSYGGNQMRADRSVIRRCGCGPVAALDLILYLTGRQKEPITLETYNRELERLCRHLFVLIPPFGLNGLMLAAGVNVLLIRHRLPYRALWAFSGEKLQGRIREMLEQDLPVILAIGPNFPAVWGKNRLNFYIKTPNGSFVPAASTLAHYVTATGSEGNWLRIASWGKEYYINWEEYRRYVRDHSISLVSNLLYLKKIR